LASQERKASLRSSDRCFVAMRLNRDFRQRLVDGSDRVLRQRMQDEVPRLI